MNITMTHVELWGWGDIGSDGYVFRKACVELGHELGATETVVNAINDLNSDYTLSSQTYMVFAGC